MSTHPVVPSRILLFRRPITELVIVPAYRRNGTQVPRKSRSPNFAIGSRPDLLRRSLPASFNRRPLPGHCIYLSVIGLHSTLFARFLFLYFPPIVLPSSSFLLSPLTLNLFFLFSFVILRPNSLVFSTSDTVFDSSVSRRESVTGNKKRELILTRGNLVSRIGLVVVEVPEVRKGTVQKCSH